MGTWIGSGACGAFCVLWTGVGERLGCWSAEGGRRGGRSRRCARSSLACGLRAALSFAVGLVAPVAAAPAARAEPGRPSASGALALRIDHPQPGQPISDALAFLAGRAVVQGDADAFDVMFVLDRSLSTAEPSGTDVDQDGQIARRGCGWLPQPLRSVWSLVSDCAAGDSVFAAEIAAVRGLLEQLDPGTTRVGLVSFSGDGDGLSADAEVRAPLTADYARVREALNALEDEGPRGRTNMRAAIQVATIELSGTASAFSERRRGAERILVFLTDGVPTLPFEGQTSLNRALAIESAVLAGKLGIRIDTYGIGPEALSEPVEIVEMARLTGGVFTPVTDPRELQPILDTLRFQDVSSVEVRNLTTGRTAQYVTLAADGSFAALVEGQPGTNQLEVVARAPAGASARRRLQLRFTETGEPPVLEPRLMEQRNRLLERRLADLRERNLAIAEQRDAELRRELTLRIERERRRAQERVRELLIEAEDLEEAPQ